MVRFASTVRQVMAGQTLTSLRRGDPSARVMITGGRHYGRAALRAGGITGGRRFASQAMSQAMTPNVRSAIAADLRARQTASDGKIGWGLV